MPAGKVDKTSILSAVDLLPTFCELAGVQLPRSYKPDGISQVAALKGNGNSKRTKPLYWKMGAAWPPREAKPDHWVSYAVASMQWKLVANNDLSHFELFDLEKDPLEKKDLKDEKPDVAKDLLAKIRKWKSTLPAKPTGNVFSGLRKTSK